MLKITKFLRIKLRISGIPCCNNVILCFELSAGIGGVKTTL
jgi:hypothetical protein